MPVAESRSSYDGLLVFAFIAVSALATVEIIHRFASRRVRRGPAWACGYLDASPATQYTAGSFAQPIRRVFGDVVFLAREHVDMPPPGDLRAGAAAPSPSATSCGTGSTLRSRNAVSFTADKLSYLQFLTIRQFLSLVFGALVTLLFLLMMVMLVWT